MQSTRLIQIKLLWPLLEQIGAKMGILTSLLLLAAVAATMLTVASSSSSPVAQQREQPNQPKAIIWSKMLSYNKGPPNLTTGDIELFSKNETEISLGISKVVMLSNEASEAGESQLRRFKRRTRNSALMPEFSAPIGNVTAALGRDVRLVCTIENLGKYQVAWLKEETKTILSIDTNIIITNYRIFLIPDEEERKWVLHIKDVQESDRGFYQCQVNTNPMRATSGYLEVVVPPTIIEAQTSQVAEVVERSNVSIQCKANGHPRPSVSWRRDDGLPIRLNGRFDASSTTTVGGDSATGNDNNQLQQRQASHILESAGFVGLAGAQFAAAAGATKTPATTTTAVPALPPSSSPFMSSQLNDVKSDKLTLYDIDRAMAGIYVCTASNGIPAHASKRIPVYVKFAPKTSVQNKYISVSLGDQLEVDCLIEAFPKANSYWSKKSVQQQSAAWQHAGRAGDSVAPLTSLTAARWSQLALVSPPLLDRRAISSKQKQHQSAPTSADQMLLSDLNAAAAADSRLMNFSSAQDVKLNQYHHQSTHHEQQLQFPGGHPHNRIQLRQAGSQQFGHHRRDDDLVAAAAESPSVAAGFEGPTKTNSMMAGEMGSSSSAENSENGAEHEGGASSVNPGTSSNINESAIHSNNSSSINNKGAAATAIATQSDSKAYVTVKQTAINLYTYRLRMTISRMQLEDYGEYSCISSNSMGASESSIIVTKADKISERNRMTPQLNSDYHPIPDERDYQRDSLLDSGGGAAAVGKPYTQAAEPRSRSSSPSSSSSSSPSGNRVIYDENYLQAIKSRQSNLVNSGRSQQKLKLRQFSDRNGATSIRSSIQGIGFLALIMEVTVAAAMAAAFLHINFVV